MPKVKAAPSKVNASESKANEVEEQFNPPTVPNKKNRKGEDSYTALEIAARVRLPRYNKFSAPNFEILYIFNEANNFWNVYYSFKDEDFAALKVGHEKDCFMHTSEKVPKEPEENETERFPTFRKKKAMEALAAAAPTSPTETQCKFENFFYFFKKKSNPKNFSECGI